METAFQSWKGEQLETFCALQCAKDICSCRNKGFLKIDENALREKRQANEVNIQSSLITQSTFINGIIVIFFFILNFHKFQLSISSINQSSIVR